MYPKVKVKDQNEDDDQGAGDDQIRSSSTFFNDFQALSIYDSCFSVMEQQDVKPPLVIRIPMPYVAKVVKSACYVPQEQNNEKYNERFDEDEKTNIRASPILRPRAVLSSPDNDAVIGNKNRIKKPERPLSLKNHNLIENRHSQCKAITKKVNTEQFVKTGKPEDSDNKKNVSGNKGSATKGRFLRGGKPSPLRI